MAKIASKISKLIANKYRVDRITNSFSYKPKDNPKDLIQTEIGDSKDTTKLQPQIKIMRWDNEVNVSFRLIFKVLLFRIKISVLTNDFDISILLPDTVLLAIYICDCDWLNVIVIVG